MVSPIPPARPVPDLEEYRPHDLAPPSTHRVAPESAAGFYGFSRAARETEEQFRLLRRHAQRLKCRAERRPRLRKALLWFRGVLQAFSRLPRPCTGSRFAGFRPAG